MRTFVINLKASVDRRAHIAAQLDPLGVPYEFFEAVEGARGIAFFSGYDERRYVANTGRVVSPTEAACFASHASLWKLCVASREPMVVLEDDAAISPSFPEALRVAEKSIRQYGFIRLQEYEGASRSQHIRSIPLEQHGDLTLAYCTRVPFGAMAYALSPDVAARFVAKSAVLTEPVDLFLKKFWEHGQPVFALLPGCVRASAFCVKSTIEQREKLVLDVRGRLMRALVKLDNGFSRARFNLVYRAKQLERKRPGD